MIENVGELLPPARLMLTPGPSNMDPRVYRALATPLVLWPQPAAPSALATLYASFTVSHHLFGGLLWFGLIAWSLARTGGLLSQATGASRSALAGRGTSSLGRTRSPDTNAAPQ